MGWGPWQRLWVLTLGLQAPASTARISAQEATGTGGPLSENLGVPVCEDTPDRITLGPVGLRG